MKKRLYFITILLSATVLSLSSCLKDSRYVDFSKGPSLVEFNLGGLSYFGQDAITATNAIDTVQFAVSVASVTVPTTATTITLAVDNSIVASYNAANPAITYLPIPAADYKLSATSVTIPAGQRAAIVTLYVYKSLLDATQSYMLPVKIASTTGGYTISGNMGIHYYHIIGNDFAGTYNWNYQRYNGPDSTSANSGASGLTTTILPVSPTEMEVYSGYVSGAEFRYDITFTKTGTGPTATYSNFHVALDAGDVAAEAASITVQQQPVFFDPATQKPGTADLAGPYTMKQIIDKHLFHFQWEAHTSGSRYILDTYYK